ncbi:hypothetical protein [Acidiphilium sp. JA12-A1]|nr:hypothetical protein [Acidiphilium sp. JA12-A1]
MQVWDFLTAWKTLKNQKDSKTPECRPKAVDSLDGDHQEVWGVTAQADLR